MARLAPNFTYDVFWSWKTITIDRDLFDDLAVRVTIFYLLTTRSIRTPHDDLLQPQDGLFDDRCRSGYTLHRLQRFVSSPVYRSKQQNDSTTAR